MDDSSASSERVLQLAEEFIERYRLGQRPPLSEYVAKYPELAAQIREVFPALAMVERVAIDDESLQSTASGSQEAELSQIGDFRIIREVGRGGMGIVYEAEQVSLGRRVAVKVLPKSVFNRDKVRRRFAREAKAAAMLHHTNIVPVFGVGEQDDLNYYVMQFIQGQSLDQVLTELRRLQAEEKAQGSSPRRSSEATLKTQAVEPPLAVIECSAEMVARTLIMGQYAETALMATRDGENSSSVDPTVETPAWDSHSRTDETRARGRSETLSSDGMSLWRSSGTASRKSKRYAYYLSVARIGAQIADALQHAHQQGIIHRDVKPSNLLLDTHGNVWVTDFGLAKASDQQDLTHTGDILGTLRYMAPEQFHGKADQRTDVYALGLTLYEMLALRPAYDARDRNQLVKQVAAEAAPELKSIDGQLPTDLTTIIQKAIDRDPAHRYQSAQEMKDDLNRFLNDEPIQARRTSTLVRLARWSRKNPAVASLAASVAALLAIVAIGSSLAAFRFERLAERNANLVVDANQAKEQAVQDRALALVAQNEAQLAQGEAEDARDKEKTLREEAETQRDRANTNANRARRAVDQYLSKITDNELLSVPGLQPLRQELLSEAMKFYAEFTQEQTDDPELQLELAKASFRLGTIHRELGNSEPARLANTDAIRQLETLRDRQLGGQDVLESLAEAYFFARRYQETIALCEQILQRDPTAIRAQSTLAEAHNTLAIDSTSDASTTFAHHQKAYEIRRRLVERQPDSAEFNAELAATINNLGVLLSKQKKPHDALEMYELSLVHLEKAVKLAPYSIMWGRWYANSLRNCSSMRANLDQQEQALQNLDTLVAVRRRLVHQNPAVTSLYDELYRDLLLLANRQRVMGMSNESMRSYRDAQVVLTQIPRDTPEELFELATVYASLAGSVGSDDTATNENPDLSDERTRNVDLAMQTLQQAVEQGWSDAKALNATRVLDSLRDRDDFKELSRVVNQLSEANRLVAGTTNASEQQKLADQEKASAILNDLATETASSPKHLRALATTTHALGAAQTGLKQFDEAEKSLNEAVKRRESLREADPDDPLLTLDWLSSRMALGVLHWQQRQFPEAHRIWQDCLQETLRLSQEHRDDKQLQARIAALEFTCVNRYGQAGLLPYVWEYFSRRLQFAITRMDQSPAAALLFAPDREQLSRYLAQKREQGLLFSYPESEYAYVHLLRLAPWAGYADADLDRLITRSERIGRERLDETNREPLLAAALGFVLRGDLDGADRMLAECKGQSIESIAAMIAWKRGNHDLAHQLLATSLQKLSTMHHAMLGLDWLNENSGYVKWWHGYWYDYASWRMAAEMLADGEKPQDDPWIDLIFARGYGMIGEAELAEAKVDQAIQAAPDNIEILLLASRIVERPSQSPQLKERLNQAVASADLKDPLPLIHRGRWYAQQGDLAKAEADYAKAAALTPNELNKFLEAGWWVMGPYPSELKESCPPEISPDPSVPMPVIDPKSGYSDQSTAWQSVSINSLFDLIGQSKLLQLGRYPGGSAYALTHVYSPDQRSTSIVIHNDSLPAVIWVNGQRLDAIRADSLSWLHMHHADCTLKPGLNTILVRFSLDKPLQISLADQLLVRAYQAFKFGNFQDAAELFAQAAQNRDDSFFYSAGGMAALLSGDHTLFKQFANLYEQVLKVAPNSVDKMHVVEMLGLATPDLIERAQLEKWFLQWQEKWRPDQSPWEYSIAATAQYRLSNFQEAIELCEKDPRVRNWPVLAMANFRLGNDSAAKAWLNRTSDHLSDEFTRFPGDGSGGLWLFVPLHREALELITGDSVDFDIGLESLLEKRRALWEQRDLLTHAYDQSIVEAPNDPMVYVARSKRLTELGRFKEADRDFNRAVELKPTDVEILLARAIFRADQGMIEKAADDAVRIFQIGLRDAYFTLGLDVESQLAAREDLLQELLRRQPNNSAFHRLEGDRLAYQGRWKEAHNAYTSDGRYWSHEVCSAAISALLGDTNGHAEAMKQFDTLRESGLADPVSIKFYRIQMQLLMPLPQNDATNLVDEIKSSLETTTNSAHQGLLGIAQLRSSQLPEAMANLNAAIHSVHGLGWHFHTYLWPAYAMAAWKSGDQLEARKYLDRTADYLKQSHRISHRDRRIGGVNISNMIWLATHALHHEARTLIDGPEAAEAELAMLIRGDTDEPSSSWRDHVLSLLNHAVDNAGQDHEPLLRRARWYASVGKHDEAAADLAAIERIVPEGHPLKMLTRETSSEWLQFWDFSSLPEAWPLRAACEVVPTEHGITLTPTGWDPQMLENVSAPAGPIMITMCVRTLQQLVDAQFFWTTEATPLVAESMSVHLSVPQSESWQVVRVIVKTDSDLRSLRFDPPNDSTTPINLAWILLARITPEELKRLINQGETGVLAGVAASHMEAEAQFAAGNLETAAEIWERDLQAFPYAEAGWSRLALCYAKLGDFPKAASSLERGIDYVITTEHLADFRLYHAVALSANEQYDEAIGEFNELLNSVPWSTKGRTFVRAESQRCTAWLLKGDLASHQNRCSELLLLLHKGDDPQLRTAIVSCCRLHPNSVQDWADVLRIAEQNYERTPNVWDARYDLFTILCHAGKAKEALERFANNRNDRHASLAIRYAACDLLLGNADPARQALQTFDLPSLYGEYYPNLKLLRQQLSEQLAAFDAQQENSE